MIKSLWVSTLQLGAVRVEIFVGDFSYTASPTPTPMPTLTFQRSISAPPETVFDLCRSVDFHVKAAKSIKARAVAHRTTGLAELNDRTTYSARFFGLRFRLTTRLTAMDAPHSFREELERGLFQEFSHHYTLQAIPQGTLLQDQFSFRAPFGPLGRIFETLILKRALVAAQHERLDAIQTEAEYLSDKSHF